MGPTPQNWLAFAFMLTTLACERQPPAEPPADSTASTIGPALVIACVTEAVEKLGWLGRGAHAGHLIATARDAGLVPAACDPLTAKSYDFGYPLADGGTLHWFVEDIQPKGEDVLVTLAFTCHESGCSGHATASVILPPGWFCLGWIHLDDHGTQCFRSEAECEQGRKEISRETTPCSRDAGAAYCATRGQETRCFPSPWACTRESGGSIIDGTCKRTDR
jgi:hypothetical protein